MAGGEVDLSSLTQRLAEHNQEHLVRFWNDLNDSERERLHAELTSLDLGYIAQCFKNCQEELTTVAAAIDDQLDPLPESVLGSLVRTDVETLRRYEDIGMITTIILIILCFRAEHFLTFSVTLKCSEKLHNTTGLLISVPIQILYRRYFRSIGIADTFVREYRERYRRYFFSRFLPIFDTDTTRRRNKIFYLTREKMLRSLRVPVRYTVRFLISEKGSTLVNKPDVAYCVACVRPR